MWKIMTAILGVVVVGLIVSLVLFQGNNSSKIKSLEDEKSNLKDSLSKQYEKEIVGLKDENVKLAQALNDPTKRIPNLVERTKVLAKETINFYQEKDSQLLAKLLAIKEDYNKGRNDPEIFINVKNCLEAKESFRGSTEEYKEFSKSYLEFLADKQSELTASGIEIDNIKTNIQKNLSNNADNLSGMEKGMALIQEADIAVYADKGWQPANLTLSYGDTVYVVAKGNWSIRSSGAKIDADGEEMTYKIITGFEVKLGALICKIADLCMGKAGEYGKRFSFIAKTDGPLYFTVNDEDRGNNAGKLDVKVIVVKKQ